MRMSDQRYAKDRLAYDVAVRLIDFEARTGTIRRLTGLADHRIRKLFRNCGAGARPGPARRHRGASPHCLHSLLDRRRAKEEAAALLGLCQLMGVTGREETGRDLVWNRIARAERLCDAYWTFRYLLPEANISFEHMLLLLTEAAKGEEWAATPCGSCGALMLVDRLAISKRLCPHCEAEGAIRHDHACETHLRVAQDPAPYR